MNLNRNLAVLILAGLVNIQPVLCPAVADDMVVSSTRVESFTLPSGTKYLLVDPISGNVRGSYDVSQKIDVQTVPAGTVLVDQTNGNLIASIDPSGTIVDITVAPAVDPLVAGIDARRSELNKLINTALNDGKLSEKQAKDLREELDRIGRRQFEDTRQGRRLTYSESIYLASALNDLSDKLGFITNNRMEPLVGSRFVANNDKVVMALGDLDYRRASLSRQVDNEYMAGKIMFPEAKEIKDQLNSAISVEQLNSVESRLNNRLSSR